jgi:hypothetical protein
MIGGVINPQVFSAVKNQAWVTKEYLKGASAIQFKTDWGHKATGLAYNVNDQFAGGPFTVKQVGGAPGNLRCTMDSISGEPVKVVQRLTTSEVMSIPTSQLGITQTEAAYGSWSFWGKFPDTSSGIACIIGSLPNAATTGAGYHLSILSATNRVTLTRTAVGGIIDLNPAPFDTKLWHHYHVTRRYDGTFELFVDLVSYGTALQNTVTTSKYMTVYLGTTDSGMIALSDIRGGHAITKYLGVVPPNMG